MNKLRAYLRRYRRGAHRMHSQAMVKMSILPATTIEDAGWFYDREDLEDSPDYATPHDTFPVGKKSDLVLANNSDIDN